MDDFLFCLKISSKIFRLFVNSWGGTLVKVLHSNIFGNFKIVTTKKNGNTYYYYNCHDCKVQLKENIVNEFFSQFIDELVEYDSVVNQFFLPTIRQKFDKPKQQLEKELNSQKGKLERIRNY